MPEEITPNLENTNDDASRIREEIRGHVHSGEVPTSPTEDVTDLVRSISQAHATRLRIAWRLR